MSKKNKRKLIGVELANLWDELEQDMGEMAAYHVACEQLGIDPDDGMSLLAECADEIREKGKEI